MIFVVLEIAQEKRINDMEFYSGTNIGSHDILSAYESKEFPKEQKFHATLLRLRCEDNFANDPVIQLSDDSLIQM